MDTVRTPKRLSIEDFLSSVNTDLLQYVPDLRRLGFTTSYYMKFFQEKDINEFASTVPEAHKRNLLNMAAKQRTPNSHLGLDCDIFKDRETVKTKKALFAPVNDNSLHGLGQYAVDTKCEDENTFVYKTPLQEEMATLEDETRVKQVELESATEFLESLTAKFSNPLINGDRSRQQCGLCHMRSGHTKRNCPQGPCVSAMQCNDIDKHPQEKKQVNDAAESKRQIEKDLSKFQTDLKAKQLLEKQVSSSFISVITPHLVNSNPDDYTFRSNRENGRLLKSQKINCHSYILEQHYKGKIPLDLERERKNFPQIIEEYFNKFKRLGKKDVRQNDPVRKRLQENPTFNVKFPKFGDECYNSANTRQAPTSHTFPNPESPDPSNGRTPENCNPPTGFYNPPHTPNDTNFAYMYGYQAQGSQNSTVPNSNFEERSCGNQNNFWPEEKVYYHL